MKAVDWIFKTIKIPFKFIIGSSPIKLISPFNVKVVAVKISRNGKKIIVNIAFIVLIISSSGVENQKMIESSCIFPAKMALERVIELPNGEAINHPWSPEAKYAANSTKTSSGKAPNLRRRRFLSLPGSNSRFNSDQQLPNPGYQKPAPSLNDSKSKPGRSLRIRSILTIDENEEMKTIYYNKDGQMIDRLDESKFLNDVDLARDGSPNPTDQHIQSETKSQAEDAQNQNSTLIKARNNLTPVKDDKLTSEGGFINSLELS